VGSLLNAISMSEGKSNVKYTDLKPQMVDVHTIAPRIPALRIGMNAIGHNIMHVHSDEGNKWSAEILSSGATAGFAFTDRQKGLQKGDASKPGSHWSLYSASKIMRVKDAAAGDILKVADGSLTLTGNKGKGATKPRLTVEGSKDSVPRITLVSKKGDAAKHISLYNRFGKFGVFSGVTENSIMHISADGSELALTTKNVQPHITIESSAKGKTSQELILTGSGRSLKMFHKDGNLGFCGIAKKGSKCASFLQSTTTGEVVDIISQATKATLKISHRVKGGTSALHLVSQDTVGTPASTNMYNDKGNLVFKSVIKSATKTLLTITPTASASFHGKLEVRDSSKFKKDAHFHGNINVDGVVTMQGKSMTSMMSNLESAQRENLALRQRMEEMERESRMMQNRMSEVEQQNEAMSQRMERMMSALELMQETTSMS